MKGTLGKYRTIECPYKYLWTCIVQWCDQFRSCLHQTPEWSSLCSSQFRWFLKKRFDITASGVQNGSYIRNLRLRYCYATYSWRWWWRPLKYKFSITTTAYHCHSEKQPNEGMNSQHLSTGYTGMREIRARFIPFRNPELNLTENGCPAEEQTNLIRLPDVGSRFFPSFTESTRALP